MSNQPPSTKVAPFDLSADKLKLSSAYREFDCHLRYRHLMAALVISMIGVPAGFALDYVIYPDHVGHFFAIRVGVDLALLCILVVLYFSRNLNNLALLKFLGVLSTLIISLVFCLMIYATDGAKSPYYAGISLILAAMATLLPWTVLESALACMTSYTAYVLACVANAGIGGAFSERLIYSNSFFILITGAVCVSCTYFLSRARFEDFRLRHQLDEQNRELQDLDRLKTQFFSNVSHELRTPLTLILGPAETLLSAGDDLDKTTHENLLVIHRNSLRLLKLINDLLDLTRLDEGAEILRKREVDLEPFLKGIVESVRHLGQSKELRIKAESDEALKLSADPIRLEKVFVNLLTNAIKYTQPGGQISVRWRRVGESAEIEVEDTGVGIPAEDLPRIFDRFHQVSSNSTNQTQGVGIGLALAKELVGKHGGLLTVTSEVGKGSVFRVALPIDSADEPVDPPRLNEIVPLVVASEEPFEKAFRSADRSWRNNEQLSGSELPLVGEGDNVILVADDEPDMRRFVVSLLATNYRVVQSPNAQNVPALVERHKPDLVLLDWMMPGKDGFTLCRELKAMPENRDLKIVLLTARVDEKSKLDALEAGADDFLTKPFSSTELLTRAANLVRSAHLQKDIRQRNEELTAAIRKLQLTEAQLIQSEKMNAIGSLSAGLLHEINNPLNYTLTAIDIAFQMKDSLSPDIREIISDVHEGMVRIRDVITHLKNFAYPEKPGTESTFAIAEAFLAARKIVAGELEGVAVEYDLPESLVIRGQKTQITHLFMNLLSNAGKALGEKPPVKAKAIAVRGHIEHETIVIECEDNGPGIPQEVRDRIFEPFFTTRDVGAGMGMGLSVCHTIVDSHRGTITVKNSTEGGAIFTVTLPLAAELATL